MGWSAWTPLGSPPPGFRGGPALVSRRGGDLEMNAYVVGTDGALWQLPFFGGTWHPWFRHDTPIDGGSVVPASAPAAGSRTPGDEHVLVLGSDGHVWLHTWNGQAWDGWVDLGAPDVGLTGPPATVSRDPGNGNLYARGTDGALWQQSWTKGHGWFGWGRFPGSTGLLDSPPAATSLRAGHEAVLARRADGEIWTITWDASTGWTDWTSMGAPPVGAVGAPAAVARPGALDVWATGADGRLWQRPTFDDWRVHDDGEVLDPVPPAAASWTVTGAADSQHVAVRGRDGGLWIRVWDPSPGLSSARNLVAPAAPAPAPGIRTARPVARPDDLLAAELVLVDAELAAGRLVRRGPQARVELVLPYQHVAEPFGFDWMAPPTPAGAAEQTVLAFALPDGEDEIDLGDAGLLDTVEQWPVLPEQTSVELPARFVLQPFGDAGWRLADPPQRADGRTAIWRGRYQGAELRGDRCRDMAPAGWAPEEILPTPEQLRRRAAGVFRAARFAVSGLGATVTMDGPVRFADRDGTVIRVLDRDGTVIDWGAELLNTWQHEAVQGRDTAVRVLVPGMLSSGHRAVLVTETARDFGLNHDRWVGHLVSTQRVVVTEPDLDLDAVAGRYEHGGREIPFGTLRIAVAQSPVVPTGQTGETPFLVQGPAGPYEFPMVGVDRSGRPVSFTMPLVFGPLGAAPAIAALYARVDRNRSTGGQEVAFAAAPAARVRTASVQFAATAVSADAILPRVESVAVHLEAARQFADVRVPLAARLSDNFLRHGLDGPGNPGSTLFTLDTALPLSFPPASVGGVASPAMAVDTVSTVQGLVPGGLLAGAAPNVDALLADARVLGQIKLAHIVNRAQLGAPLLTVEKIAAGDQLHYRWKPVLDATDHAEAATGLVLRDGAQLTLDATTVRSGTGVPDGLVRGELTRVTFALAGVIAVDLERITFTSRRGAKPEVQCSGLSIRFQKELEFLNTLKEHLPPELSKAAAVEVTPAGITAGYVLALPNTTLGVLAISNLTMSVRLEIPFDDRPAAVEFAIAERSRPFTVAVSLFGGGGFLALRATTDGLERLAASIEFGGSFSLDILGLASGGVYLMAGVYFETGPGGYAFHGFLRCGGYLSVLGIIGISVEFYAELEFRKDGRRTLVRARASVTVGVRLLFFTKSVTLPFERTFDGGDGDPSFAECVAPEDWDAYCDAFAVEPA